MLEVTKADKEYSVAALESVIRKSERTLESMIAKNPKASAIHLTTQRLKATKIALSILHSEWDGVPFTYDLEETKETRDVINKMLPTLIKFQNKFQPGTAQHTLATRRIMAYQFAATYLGHGLHQQHQQHQ